MKFQYFWGLDHTDHLSVPQSTNQVYGSPSEQDTTLEQAWLNVTAGNLGPLCSSLSGTDIKENSPKAVSKGLALYSGTP